MTQPLSITVVVSKPQLTTGDRLTITATIRNISSETFHFMATPDPYPTAHVKLFSVGDTRPLHSYITSIFEIAPLSRRDFVELHPGDQVTMSFGAELRQEAIHDRERKGHPVVRGLFLVFQHSSILIPSKGTYALRFQIRTGEIVSREAQEKFDIRDVWTGKVVSDPVEIVVR